MKLMLPFRFMAHQNPQDGGFKDPNANRAEIRGHCRPVSCMQLTFVLHVFCLERGCKISFRDCP